MSESSNGGAPAPTPEAQAKAHDPARVSPEPTPQALERGLLSVATHGLR